jgi:hypothetical protein
MKKLGLKTVAPWLQLINYLLPIAMVWRSGGITALPLIRSTTVEVIS